MKTPSRATSGAAGLSFFMVKSCLLIDDRAHPANGKEGFETPAQAVPTKAEG
jgi:hypothetical protein